MKPPVTDGCEITSQEDGLWIVVSIARDHPNQKYPVVWAANATLGRVGLSWRNINRAKNLGPLMARIGRLHKEFSEKFTMPWDEEQDTKR